MLLLVAINIVATNPVIVEKGGHAPSAKWPIPTMHNESEQRAFFESATIRMMDRLYGAAVRFTRNSADAEDLVAEALTKAWGCLDQLEDRNSFDGWIMRILSNTFVSQWRRQKTRNEIFDDDVYVDDLDDKDSLYARLHQPFLLWWGTPEQTFVNNLLEEDIEKAFDGLPDSYRIVAVMVEVLGFTYAEAAESLELPVGTVRSRLNRGRRQLQNALWQNACEAGIVSGTISDEEGKR